MRLPSAWFVIAAAAAIVGSVPGDAHAQAAAASRTGSEVFTAACVSCHGTDGRGNPKATVGFEVEVPDFSDCKFATPEATPDWHIVIENGGGARAFDRMMPAFRDALSADEIQNVIGYLRGFCRDRRWPLGDLNLPRPLVTEKAFPENETVFTTSFDTEDGLALSNAVLYERRLGARSQYEIVVPFDLRRSPERAWIRGLGDVALAFKHVLFAHADRGSILSGGAEVTFPTGKEAEGLGGGVTMLEPFVAFGQILPADGFVQVHAGLERSTNHAVADDEGYVKTAVGRSFTQPQGGRIWSPMIELLAVREFAAGRSTQWDSVPQMQVTLSRRQHIVISLGAQLPINQRARRSSKLLVYFLWDWFDGGLFEGW